MLVPLRPTMPRVRPTTLSTQQWSSLFDRTRSSSKDCFTGQSPDLGTMLAFFLSRRLPDVVFRNRKTSVLSWLKYCDRVVSSVPFFFPLLVFCRRKRILRLHSCLTGQLPGTNCFYTGQCPNVLLVGKV